MSSFHHPSKMGFFKFTFGLSICRCIATNYEFSFLLVFPSHPAHCLQSALSTLSLFKQPSPPMHASHSFHSLPLPLPSLSPSPPLLAISFRLSPSSSLSLFAIVSQKGGRGEGGPGIVTIRDLQQFLTSPSYRAADRKLACAWRDGPEQ